MAFMTGFFLLNPAYTEPGKREEVLRFLQSLGFELYEVGHERFVVFYVEAPTVDDLDKIIKMAESHDGVVKAYIAFGFLGDKAKEAEIDRALEEGEIELDESMVEYIKWILSRIGQQA